MTKGSKVKIKAIALEYSDYNNILGTVTSIEEDLIKIAVPFKSFTMEDERALHKEGDTFIVTVNKNQVIEL